MKQIALDFPQYSLDNMVKTLKGTSSIDYLYLEFISGVIGKDIYILDGEKEDVYITGDEELYHHNRASIVLYYSRNHYDLVGVISGNSITTLFGPNDKFISAIRSRINEVVGGCRGRRRA